MNPWFDELIALLTVIAAAAPNVTDIRRLKTFLDTMDTVLLRRTIFGEAQQHYAGLASIIESRSLEVAKDYLDSKGAGALVSKYYATVVTCIASLPGDVEEDCWQRLQQMNQYCQV